MHILFPTAVWPKNIEWELSLQKPFAQNNRFINFWDCTMNVAGPTRVSLMKSWQSHGYCEDSTKAVRGPGADLVFGLCRLSSFLCFFSRLPTGWPVQADDRTRPVCEIRVLWLAAWAWNQGRSEKDITFARYAPSSVAQEHIGRRVAFAFKSF